VEKKEESEWETDEDYESGEEDEKRSEE